MTTSTGVKAVQEQLVPPLQTLYNLNWKNQKHTGNHKTYSTAKAKIDFWKTAMDYHYDGKVYQVKWELDGHKVINVTFPHSDELAGLTKFLKQYLWG